MSATRRTGSWREKKERRGLAVVNTGPTLPCGSSDRLRGRRHYLDGDSVD
jgi:hypothetical protein